MGILHEVGDSASPSAVPGKILPDATIQTRVATDPDFQAQIAAAQIPLRERYPAIFDGPKPPTAISGRPILRLKKPAGPVVAAAVVARRALA